MEPSMTAPDDLALAQGTDFFCTEDLLGDEDRDIRDRVREFVDTTLTPVANSYWERDEFPRELIPHYAALGVAGGSVKGYGCPGMSALAEGLVTQELARGDGSFSTFNGVHSALVCSTVALLGSEDQKERWLPDLAGCEALGAFALTEPDHGSDVVRLGTTARRDGDHWVLDGAKRWIGNGTVAGLVVVCARDEKGHVGAFVVDRRAGEPDGYTASVITGKTSNRAVWHADITLDGVRIPADHRLAGARTFDDITRCLTKSRQSVAWEGLGHAIGAYECALAYARRRRQFGKPITAFQLVQDKFSRMLSDITAMQLTCLRMAQLQGQGRITPEQVALAKFQTAAGGRRVCAMARDVLGGNGILLENHVARHHADIETIYTYEGTDSIQSLIVGRAITGRAAFA
jgi:glutaryl-CoA dehydrogenase